MKNRYNNKIYLTGSIKRKVSKVLAATFAIIALTLHLEATAQYHVQQPWEGNLGKTVDQTTFSQTAHQVIPPEDAPNIIYILIDDIGYGASSAFGGLIPTPAIDSLANNGLRYTNFHTTAVCSPTRTALLTGRNHHSAHVGSNAGAGTPGYDRVIPFEKGFVSEILREQGYNTFAVGKWHITPKVDQTQAGPFNRWPTGRGFDKYYGYLGGATDQYRPILWEGTEKIEKAYDDKRLLSELMTDRAINYIANQKSVAPEKPFFLYYAPTATHSPHQVDKVWSDKFKGKFDEGWDWYREQVLINQKKLGVVPADVQLAPSYSDVQEWESLTADEKRLALRHIEVYAGYLAQLDHEIGRLVDYLKDIDQLDNTLIFLSIGDNGAARAGGEFGRSNFSHDAGQAQTNAFEHSLANIDLIGTDKSNVLYPIGWAQATNTPFRYFKAEANGEGGTHNPLIVFWPKYINDKGSVRNQYTHIIDVLPTSLELAGLKTVENINGIEQDSLEGISFAQSLNERDASDGRTVQYYEIGGSRGIYKDGWKAGAFHQRGDAFENDRWELFKIDEDFNELSDLSKQHPEKLEELKAAFDQEATKYHVYPLRNGSGEESEKEPSFFDGKKHLVLYNGLAHLIEAPDFNNRSFTITADVEITDPKEEGVLFATGGQFRGLSLLVRDGKFQAIHNSGSGEEVISSDTAPLPVGKSILKFVFQADEKARSGVAAIYINDNKVSEKQLARSVFKDAWDGLSVGKDDNTAVSDSYKAPYPFTGKLKKIIIDF
ncbi:arylsulfatase [Olivibacter sp. SDN3]|uniref:arylsulfatase n=1 Tax=Olivibacter sp. SDN3 TaxID=2764720 RepID=UPI0016512BD0|nr:arylsulfatase [Olivibacter sp. SDN3]QNL48184.1 arylsulfatase [Olivibacter sp. SDN3]